MLSCVIFLYKVFCILDVMRVFPQEIVPKPKSEGAWEGEVVLLSMCPLAMALASASRSQFNFSKVVKGLPVTSWCPRTCTKLGEKGEDCNRDVIIERRSTSFCLALISSLLVVVTFWSAERPSQAMVIFGLKDSESCILAKASAIPNKPYISLR